MARPKIQAVRYETPYRKDKSKPRKKPVKWESKQPDHWQYRIDGRLLDYWPTKHTWMFAGKKWYGDVEIFVRDKEYELKLFGSMRCINCVHWTGDKIGEYRQCAVISSGDDDVFFSLENDYCDRHEIKKPAP